MLQCEAKFNDTFGNFGGNGPGTFPSATWIRPESETERTDVVCTECFSVHLTLYHLADQNIA